MLLFGCWKQKKKVFFFGRKSRSCLTSYGTVLNQSTNHLLSCSLCASNYWPIIIFRKKIVREKIQNSSQNYQYLLHLQSLRIVWSYKREININNMISLYNYECHISTIHLLQWRLRASFLFWCLRSYRVRSAWSPAAPQWWILSLNSGNL